MLIILVTSGDPHGSQLSVFIAFTWLEQQLYIYIYLSDALIDLHTFDFQVCGVCWRLFTYFPLSGIFFRYLYFNTIVNLAWITPDSWKVHYSDLCDVMTMYFMA